MFIRNELVYYRMDMLSVHFWVGGGGEEILNYWLSINSIDLIKNISAFDVF